MQHFLHDTGLYFIVKSIESKVRRRAHDVKCGIEVKCSVGKNEGASVDETECVMQRGRRERRGG